MTVFKLKSGQFSARIWDRETGKQRTLTEKYPSARAARKARDDYYNEHGAHDPISILSLQERWLRDGGAQKGWRESTRKHNQERSGHFVKAHAARRADSIRVPEALQYALEHPRELAALRAMFNYGRLIEAVQINPFQGLGVGKPKPTRHRTALTQEQVDELAEIAGRQHGPWHRALVIFAASTGLRAGEIYALKFSDLGHDEMTVRRSFSSKTGETLPPKNGRERTVIFPRVAREAVVSVPRRPHQEFVFVNPRDGQHLTAMSHGYWWRQIRGTVDPKFTFHELRHTAATLLLKRGAPAELVALQLGHVRADGTPNPELIYRVYGHPDIAQQREQLKAYFEDNVRDLRSVTHNPLTALDGGSA